jgi:hypothetical protein
MQLLKINFIINDIKFEKFDNFNYNIFFLFFIYIIFLHATIR